MTSVRYLDEVDERGPDWVREFLVRWVMEMGAGSPVDSDGLIENRWYGEETIPADHPALAAYFDFVDTPHNARINQKGLDFIEGRTPEDSGVQSAGVAS